MMGREMFFPAGIPDRQQKATNGYTCQHNSQDVMTKYNGEDGHYRSAFNRLNESAK
jgi:hypothetical protein